MATSMTELDITIRGPQGAGKTSLLKLLADAIDRFYVGKLVRYQNDDGTERCKVVVDDPVELAKLAANVEPLEDMKKAPFLGKQLPYTPDAEKLCERVSKLLDEHGIRIEKRDNKQINIGRKVEVCLLDIFYRLKDEV
jgi:MoxR-like ATPase